MRTAPKPRARRDDLIVRPLASGETMVYDRETHEVHCLNRTSALVWQRCDGTATPEAIAASVAGELGRPFTTELVEVALAELDEAGLLEEMPPQVREAVALTRRQAMSRIGQGALIAALVPLITTILAPAPAGSCKPSGASCTSGFECCSGACIGGVCA